MIGWKRAVLLGLTSWLIAASKYYSEIGVDYLVYPVFAFAARWLAQVQRQEPGRP